MGEEFKISYRVMASDDLEKWRLYDRPITSERAVYNVKLSRLVLRYAVA